MTLFLTTTLNLANAALTATTANRIQGTAPYIELNGVKATDLSSLLSIKIGSDTYISDSAGNMKKVGAGGVLTAITTAITLANAGDAFNSVKTIVAPDTTSYLLNSTTVIPLMARKDADGDGNFTITGNLTGAWKDKHGNSIGNNLTQSPTICNAPYTLTLTTTGTPEISTQYGAPKKTTYGNSSAKFTINPVSQPTICYAKPFSMHYAISGYAGPASMWDGGTTGGIGSQSNGKGFLTQSTYAQNFPTTGANGLYFDLDIAGVPASTTLTWPSVTVGTSPNAITATMSNISNTSVRVTLTGPKASAYTNGATAAAPPSLPAVFELVGEDGSGTPVVKYGFKLQKWYINTGSSWGFGFSQATWCAGLNGGNYVIAKVKDLTNASGTEGHGGTIPTVTNPSSGNYYQRRIGGGLFSEWGHMNAYTGAGFVGGIYWTGDTTGSYLFTVRSNAGQVSSFTPGSYPIYGVCTQP